MKFIFQIKRLNELNSNDKSNYQEIMNLMKETQIYRSEELFDPKKLETWNVDTIINEFKQYLSFEGEFVTIFIYFVCNQKQFSVIYN